MRFVNISNHMVISPFTGVLHPGRVSSDGGPRRRRLEEALAEVVRACGKSMGIRLNKTEMFLMEQVLALDELGSTFDKNNIPKEVRDDPIGQKRADDAAHQAQAEEMKLKQEAVEKAAMREALINGEIDERRPQGPGNMKGEPVDTSDLKSGFERILEANKAIEEGREPAKMDVAANLDPIGALAKGAEKQEQAEAADPDQHDMAGEAKVAVDKAKDKEDDAVKSADANEPQFVIAEKAGDMDKAAARIAEQLSQVGPAKKDKAKPKAKSKKSK